MSNLSDTLIGKGYGLKETLTASSTWNWTTAGKPKTVFVRMIAGAGGTSESGSGLNGGAGGNSVWDTGAVVATTTCTGGGGGTSAGVGTGTGINIKGSYLSGSPNPSAGFGVFGVAGSGFRGSAFYTGASGEIKEFEYVPTGNVVFTIGAGGTAGNAFVGAGFQGAIELYY